MLDQYANKNMKILSFLIPPLCFDPVLISRSISRTIFASTRYSMGGEAKQSFSLELQHSPVHLHCSFGSVRSRCIFVRRLKMGRAWAFGRS